VTCFFCHTIDAVTGSHNAAVSLSGDLVMRGEVTNPVENSAHASAYDPLHDRTQLASAGLCGTTSSPRRGRTSSGRSRSGRPRPTRGPTATRAPSATWSGAPPPGRSPRSRT
jgi:hypothetical protein